MGANQVTALDRVTMGVSEGEFVAIQGTSGSGKSTLLNLLGGLDRPTSGEVLFDSQPLGPLSKKQMARYRKFSVGMIFQNFNLIPTMTAAENVKLALAFGGMRGAERHGQRAAIAIAPERLRHMGEQRRVLACRQVPEMSHLSLPRRASPSEQ